MHINVKAEDVSGRLDLVRKKAEDGYTYWGVRLWTSPPTGQPQRDANNDRAAVTFWWRADSVPHQTDLVDVFVRAAALVQTVEAIHRKGGAA